MKNIIICQARMGSSRLPGKSLMPIYNQMSLLEVVLKRIVKTNNVDKVILATSNNNLDDPLEEVARGCNVEFFRGKENDVLSRFVEINKTYRSEAVIRTCADNPFLDSSMIENLVDFFWSNQPCDYSMNLGPVTGFLDSTGAEIISRNSLDRLSKEVTTNHDKEHVLTYIHNNPTFITKNMIAPPKFRRPNYRIDIDFPEDMEFVRKLIDKLPKSTAPFWTTEEIITTLDSNVNLLDIRKKREE